MWAVTRQVYASAWDGSNEADVLAMVQTITPVSGNVWTIDHINPGVTLYLRETGPGGTGLWPIHLNQVCIVAPDFGILERVSMAGFQARYRAVSDTFEAALAASPTVDAIEAAAAAAQSSASAAQNAVAAARYSGFGASALPTLIAGNTTNVVVAILPTQPGTNYVARAVAFSGAAILTAITINSVTINSAGQVTVNITNTGLVSLAGILMVHVSPVIPAPAK